MSKNPAIKLRKKRDCYKHIFNGENLTNEAQLALKDLSIFCHADRPCVAYDNTGKLDAHAMAMLEGRRQVWMRIIQTLNITDEQLIKITNMNGGFGNE